MAPEEHLSENHWHTTVATLANLCTVSSPGDNELPSYIVPFVTASMVTFMGTFYCSKVPMPHFH